MKHNVYKYILYIIIIPKKVYFIKKMSIFLLNFIL